MITLTVKPDDDDEYEVTAGARDVLVWERATKGSFSKLMDDLHMVDLYKLAHIASVRQGLYEGKLADFETGCELDILDEDGDVDVEQDDVDPTPPAR